MIINYHFNYPKFLPPATKLGQSNTSTLSEACVKNSVHGGGGGSPGPHLGEVGESGWGLQAHTQGGGCGVWLGGSPGPGEGCVSQHALRQTPPSSQQTATAAGGTHPTGIHSCIS